GFERADLREAVVDTGVRLTRGLARIAARALQVEPRTLLVGQRLAHARLDQSTGVDRDIQLHADGAESGRGLQWARGAGTRAGSAGRCDQVDRGFVRIATALGLELSDL